VIDPPIPASVDQIAKAAGGVSLFVPGLMLYREPVRINADIPRYRAAGFRSARADGSRHRDLRPVGAASEPGGDHRRGADGDRGVDVRAPQQDYTAEATSTILIAF
jgi:hypothetical protein